MSKENRSFLIENDTLTIPFDKGHYGGYADSAASLLTASRIPLGFYWGEDVTIDDAGNLRARPTLGYKVTYANDGVAPILVFKNGTYYYSIVGGGKIQYWSGAAWTDVTGISTTWTQQMWADTISSMGTASPSTVVTSGNAEEAIAYLSGTSGSSLTGYAKGLASHDEDRLFCWNGGIVYYSNRGTFTTGYASGVDGQWFSLPPSCMPVVCLANTGGSLYAIKQSANTSQMYIWKKVQTYSDDEELIDMTSWTMALGAYNGHIPNGCDGIAPLAGTLAMWIQGVGLCVLNGNGVDEFSAPVFCDDPSNLDVACTVATLEGPKLIMCKPAGQSYVLVYNYVKGIWGRWNINMTSKGFGCNGGIFGVSGTKSPAYISAFPTTSGDATIVPIVYTPAMNLGYPGYEKYLKKIIIDGRGITQVIFYGRVQHGDSWTTIKTINNPDTVSCIEAEDRFNEMYLKISGNSLFLIRSLAIQFDVGQPLILETYPA